MFFCKPCGCVLLCYLYVEIRMMLQGQIKGIKAVFVFQNCNTVSCKNCKEHTHDVNNMSL